MKAFLLVLILLVVVVIAALATGMVDINTVRGARAPTIAASENGVTATGGQAPAFEVETGSVALGTGEANVAVPKMTIEKSQQQVAVPQVEIRGADANKTAR